MGVYYALISVWPQLLRAEQALVRVYENPEFIIGQAFLTHRGNRCYAILPQHVVNEAKTPSFLSEGNNSLMGDAESIVNLDNDISVALLLGRITKNCGYGISTFSRAINQHLREQGLGVLRSVNSDGTIANMAVAIIDDDGKAFLLIQPSARNSQIQKGQSGSLLLVNAQPVGMLLSIVESSDGETVGKVIRFDKLLSSVESDLASHANEGKQDNPGNVTKQEKDLAAASQGGRIMGWSAPPIDSQHLVTNLIADGQSFPWRSSIVSLSAEIELDLAGESSIINSIRLDGKGVIAAELPDHVELSVNMNADLVTWRSILSRDVFFDKEGIAVLNFAPVWARQVKLRFSHAKGGSAIIGLNKISVN